MRRLVRAVTTAAMLTTGVVLTPLWWSLLWTILVG